ncbi:GMC family oxidoreductase [Rhodococcus maanshanensis]|uniref:Choline dehydrogenase n=1 Tax=Rhodococcus maanshanensis TaxID=183556 RepID=A0A1H7SER6_9NOCA|nr:GMC family oxidoreductase N-terminal domain-containing protein [Rhodococcus maanshanensis]SEL70017.1 choline dehydrogenase [Rhodococcus maanshanensis]
MAGETASERAALKQDVFNYVIVGAGSAGCVLAARLTEDPSVSVLLLEAGGEDDADEIKIPAAFPALFKTKWDWNYETTPQKHMDDRRAFWPRMKALGGCSSMNAMIYIRGNRADYDGWRDEHGAQGWGYEDVLPYFVRAERNSRLAGPYHGTDGPLHVEDRRYTHELTDAWIAASVTAGIKPTEDFNGAEQEGAGRYQVTCHNGRRWSTADAYLRPALGRPNLTVRTGALTTEVLLRGTRAVGVRYRQSGAERTAHASVEVLLAGGAINSPQLLMLSGIGPAEHLRDMGVEVAVNLPGVGENLQDHPVSLMLWHTRDTTDLKDLAAPVRRLAQWRIVGRGPLASNIAEGGAFFASRDGLAAPDLQLHMLPAGFLDNGLREMPSMMFTVGVTLVSVASRGRLRLASADPTWRPEIDPRYLDDPADLDALVAGCRRSLDIAGEPAIAKHIDRRHLPSGRNGLSDGELANHVRAWTQTTFHPVGTCAMGEREDAVVDSQLRVRGVDGLRVVDASVMPTVVRGNTNAPTIMIAEKAADLILGKPALR